MVTKGIGYLSEETDGDYERVTHLYKDPEGTKDRKMMLRTHKSSAIQLTKPNSKGDLFFEMVDLDKGMFGKDYNISLFLHVSLLKNPPKNYILIDNFFQNQALETRSVDIKMETWSSFYDGKKAQLIKKGLGEFLMQPNEREHDL
jgi:hypothetical protein